MSIQIQQSKCIGCGRCVEVCPGNLIKTDENGRACIRHPEDCWGCTSCLKECRACAIRFFLGADIGGMGGTFTVKTGTEGADLWTFSDRMGQKKTIQVNKKDANKY